MAEPGPARPGPIWVWLIGFTVLMIAVWLLVDWVRTRGDTVGSPPAAIFDDSVEVREAAIQDVERTSVPIALAAIVPLGPEDTGIQAIFSGVIVGDGLLDGAWVRTSAGTVFVRIVGAKAALHTGKQMRGRGIVRHDPQRVGGWLEAADIRAVERSRPVEDYYLETTADRVMQPSEE